MKLKMIQIFADWPMSHAKRVTKNYRKNPECHVAATIRPETADRQKLSRREKSWSSHVKNAGAAYAIHGCNSWLSVWTLSSRCPV